MTTSTLTYHKTAARPEATITLGDGLDVSTGYTFEVKIGTVDQTALITKTTGLTGGNGSVTVAWTAGELGVLDPGEYDIQLTATTGSLPRVYSGRLIIKAVIL